MMMFHLAEHVNEDGGDKDSSPEAEDESCAITQLVNLTRTACCLFRSNPICVYQIIFLLITFDQNNPSVSIQSHSSIFIKVHSL